MQDPVMDSNFSYDSLSKERKDIINDCLVALGYPVISLFITQEQINRLIDFAVRKCADKASPRYLDTFNVGSGVIDVSKYNMGAVSAVYSGDIGAVTGSGDGESGACEGCNNAFSGCDICSKLCMYRGFSYNGMMRGDWNNELYDMLAYQSSMSEIKNLQLDDYYLDVTNGKLYLDNYSGIVTVEYVKSTVNVEDLKNDSYWYSWVRDYTLALVKITEGRIRSKYKPTSGVYEIESDELINEGNTDKNELEERLNDQIGYWNIMRG